MATRVGGNPEAVVDNETGLLVPAHDPAALGEAVRSLALDRARARAMGLAGQARVWRHYSLERCVHDYDRLFSAIVAGSPLPADLLAAG